MESIHCANGHSVISWTERRLVGKLAECDEATFAYLLFDYFRAQEQLQSKQVMLTVSRTPGKLLYRILVRLPDDLLSGVTELAQLKAKRLIPRVDYAWISPSDLSHGLYETTLFIKAYGDLNCGALRRIPAAELQFYVRQFIRFKSVTDPRTRKNNPFALVPVGIKEADLLAADIIAVAEFYDVPVDVFLGIGAMENNFLSAPGDLNNAIWKRRAERDDIVLQKKGRKVWILNSSIGTWQITRQSLRYAQQLFLTDKRDYSRLPQRLRPAKELHMEDLNSDVLTTYAGLLLRDLLNHFDGDIAMATGAYNGTIRHPNLRYAAGVEAVASYARRVIGNTADLNRLATPMPTLTPDSNLAEVYPEAAAKLQ